MFIKSIRWRLQIWYGLILLAILAGFGFTAFQLERGRVFRLVDDGLQRRVAALRGALRPPPPHGPRPAEGPFDHPPPFASPGSERPEGNFGGREPEDFSRHLADFQLPARMANLFDETDTNGFYYALFTPDGSELVHSANSPSPALLQRSPPFQATDGESPVNAPHHGPPLDPPKPQNRELYREVTFGLAAGNTGVVGRSIAPELRELQRFGWTLAIAGTGVLLLGLAGGWWLASRALQPIEDISAAAVKISVGDLSHRINAANTESELGRLATVLNSTFARLEAAFAQQKQFTSDAAHELRTPVSVILTQTQTALNRERTAAEYRDAVESCQRSAQRMRRLIESLLELARLDAGQEPGRRMRFDLSQLVRDCVSFLQPLANERTVTVRCELEATECAGDSDRIMQVVTNLLTNAIQYNRPNGEVQISLQSREGTATLKVSDTGQGISPADLPKIFERFYRADPARSADGMHSGLGLAIAKAIVESHGGTIEASSQPGIGSIFCVRLPG